MFRQGISTTKSTLMAAMLGIAATGMIFAIASVLTPKG